MSNHTVSQGSDNVVPLVIPASGFAKNARVIALDGKAVLLEITDNKEKQIPVKGRIAFSCLVIPKVNDLVLCVKNDSGMYIVLAIIDRPDTSAEGQDMTLSFPANVHLQSPHGQIGLTAREKVTIATAGTMVCAANKTIHKSMEAQIDYKKATAKGDSFLSQFKTMHILGDVVNTMVKHMMQKFENYVRRSAVTDKVSATQMDRKVDGLFAMKTRTTLMVSKNDTKIDGERIHMG